MNGGAVLTFDDVFASAGFFGVEIGADVAQRAGERVVLRGYLYGPLATGAHDYVLARSSMRYCPCCSGEPAYGDDLVAVHLRSPLAADVHDGDREVEVSGVLALGETATGHPGLTTSVRLDAAQASHCSVGTR